VLRRVDWWRVLLRRQRNVVFERKSHVEQQLELLWFEWFHPQWFRLVGRREDLPLVATDVGVQGNGTA